MKGILWIVSYPKSGNTWLRAFIANLYADSDAPVDINRLNSVQFAGRELWDRVVGWETSELLPEEREAMRLSAQEALAVQAGETPIKTHEAFADPRNGHPRFSRRAIRGVLYVVRNPLDVAVSLSHHNGKGLDATIALMNDPGAMLGDDPNSPQEYQLICDWSGHVRSWTEVPNLPICVLRYEDMLSEPETTFSRAAQAMGWTVDSERIKRALARSRFEVLRQQEKENGFIERIANRVFFRSGRSGEWRERLTAQQVNQICARHGVMMRKLGYLDAHGSPI